MFDYQPILRATAGPYVGTAMVGTYSAIIGWSFNDEHLRQGLFGFGIRRTEFINATGEQIGMKWLGGYKRFLSQDNGVNGEVGSLTAPFQRFRWNDYTLRDTRSYRYEIFPMRGTPGALTHEEQPLVFEFSPTNEDDGTLGIYVNRGVTAAKAYYERFGDRHPRDVVPSHAAYNWLSRGLKESLLNLIAGAKNKDSIHIVVYEFHDAQIATALVDAISRGVDVKIIHDAKAGKNSTKKTDHIINEHGLTDRAIRRDKVNISHNKLAVFLEDGAPKKVWTGSSNFSENAFNYQTNSALLINNTQVAEQVEEYFQSLIDNPSKAKTKTQNRALMQRINVLPGRFAEMTYFSPLSQYDILDIAVELATNAQQLILVSSPFGLDKRIITACEANDRAIVEYGLVNATAQKKVTLLNHHNTRFFPPRTLQTYHKERWDAKAFGAHKIHSKVMIIDPYSDVPKILIGSANFSKASCKDNDENTCLITGDKRLAAVMTTEFMRMYDHYKSRWYISKNEEENQRIRIDNIDRIANGLNPIPEKEISIHLKEDDSWSNTAFNEASPSHKYRDRIVFSQQ